MVGSTGTVPTIRPRHMNASDPDNSSGSGRGTTSQVDFAGPPQFSSKAFALSMGIRMSSNPMLDYLKVSMQGERFEQPGCSNITKNFNGDGSG